MLDQIFSNDNNRSRIKTNSRMLLKFLACNLSHMLVIYYAKLRGYPFVVVFENDAWPVEDARQRLVSLLDFIDGNNAFECGLLGYTLLKSCIENKIMNAV